MTWRVIQADCIQAMQAMDASSVDAIVTDPPYGLEFMGKEWDRLGAGTGVSTEDTPAWTNGSGDATDHGATPFGGGGQRVRYGADARTMQEWHQAWAEAALRVLKPGGHLLAFGGTRTYHRLACGLEDAGFEIRDCLAWLYGSGFPKSLDVSKAIDKAAGMEREVVGHRMTGAAMTGQQGNGATNFGSGQNLVADTAPATPDAEHWQGWGTALKPAWESIVWATKPQVVSDVADRIGSWLAQAADQLTPTGAAGGSSDRTATSPSGSGAVTGSSIVSSWKACWDDLCERTNTFTIGTTSSTTTALTTLWSCLSEITPESITKGQGNEWSSHVRSADALLAGIRASTLDTLELSAIVTATAQGHTSPLDAGEPEPAFEPIVLARKPLGGTVAQNVLEHGTGALNIDGTRIGMDEDDPGHANYHQNRATAGPYPVDDTLYKLGMESVSTAEHPGGRWPANVLLDEEAAGMLDEQTGELHRGWAKQGRGWQRDGYVGGESGRDQGLPPMGYPDHGGASRFFYVPKADREERNRGLEHLEPQGYEVSVIQSPGRASVGDTLAGKQASRAQNNHPTVKPVELMQWLCRLITPPGGTILDPFTGSGSTGIAALREGFSFIGIERESEYVQIARDRVIGDAPLFNVESESPSPLRSGRE